MRERHLTTADLVIPAETASDEEIRGLITASKAVFVF
jgi:hypothetical protein